MSYLPYRKDLQRHELVLARWSKPPALYFSLIRLNNVITVTYMSVSTEFSLWTSPYGNPTTERHCAALRGPDWGFENTGFRADLLLSRTHCGVLPIKMKFLPDIRPLTPCKLHSEVSSSDKRLISTLFTRQIDNFYNNKAFPLRKNGLLKYKICIQRDLIEILSICGLSNIGTSQPAINSAILNGCQYYYIYSITHTYKLLSVF